MDAPGGYGDGCVEKRPHGPKQPTRGRPGWLIQERVLVRGINRRKGTEDGGSPHNEEESKKGYDAVHG